MFKDVHLPIQTEFRFLGVVFLSSRLLFLVLLLRVCYGWMGIRRSNVDVLFNAIVIGLGRGCFWVRLSSLCVRIEGKDCRPPNYF